MMADFFEFDVSDPLTITGGESPAANAALRDYAMMGPGRSQRALWRRYCDQESTEGLPPTKKLSVIKTWCTRYAWVSRVAAWTIIKNETDEEMWDRRRAELREADWFHALELRDLCVRILAEGPSFLKTTRRPGRPRVIEDGVIVSEGRPEIVTVALDSAALARLEKVASELARLAAGEETTRARTDVVWRVVREDEQG